jgi:hypothetical protein
LIVVPRIWKSKQFGQ